MNFLTVKQRNRYFPLGTRRSNARWLVLHAARRIHRRVCFSPTGPRWFVRCRCGRRATACTSTNIGRPNVYTRWFCDEHRAEFERHEEATNPMWLPRGLR